MTEIEAPVPVDSPTLAPSTPVGQRMLRSDAVRFITPLVVAIIAISIYTNNENSNFLGGDNIKNILLQVAGLGIIAIGQTLLIAAGQLDLSVATLAALAGVIGATRIKDGGSELWAVVLVLAICAGVGLIWGLLVAGLRIPPFILTLGGTSLFLSLALRISGSSPVPARDRFEWLGRAEPLGVQVPIWFFIIIALVAAVVMRYTRFGRHVYATGSNEEASYLAGIPTARTKVICFVVSSTLSGFAGLVAMARISNGDPRVGSQLALQAIAAVVLGGATLAGGRGSPLGTFFGVLLLGVVQSALTFNDVKTFWNDAVFGGVLIFAVIVTAIGDMRRRRSGTRSVLSSWVQRTPPGAPVAPPPPAGAPAFSSATAVTKMITDPSTRGDNQ